MSTHAVATRLGVTPNRVRQMDEQLKPIVLPTTGRRVIRVYRVERVTAYAAARGQR